MTSPSLRRLLLVAIVTLHHHQHHFGSHRCGAVAEPLGEKLFFKDDESEQGTTRTVRVGDDVVVVADRADAVHKLGPRGGPVQNRGDDVVLECEAAGRPSPIIYWQHKGRSILQPQPVHSPHSVVALFRNCRQLVAN